MALLVMSSSIISAQEKVIHLDEVIVSSQEESEKAFGQLSNYIAFDDDFKYRYELRKSKLTNKVYYFPDTTIAKTQVLKHFKKVRNFQNWNQKLTRNHEVAQPEAGYLQKMKNFCARRFLRCLAPHTAANVRIS